jgi:hypothetical protein
MKLDSKKIKALALTYGSLALPIAAAAFAMNASFFVKVLSFASGLLPVIIRQANPKDPFTINFLAVAQAQVDAELAKQKKNKK